MQTTKPIEKFVVVRNSRPDTGEIVAQVQRFTGATAYYPDAAAAHKAPDGRRDDRVSRLVVAEDQESQKRDVGDSLH